MPTRDAHEQLRRGIYRTMFTARTRAHLRGPGISPLIPGVSRFYARIRVFHDAGHEGISMSCCPAGYN